MWRIIAQENGDIYVWKDSKFRTLSARFNQIEDYLIQWVNPEDVITFVNFLKKDVKISGEKFLQGFNA